MVPQWNSFTNLFSPNSLRRALSAGLLSLGLLGALPFPAHALVKMETKSINAALVYGMQNQKLGLANILGPNWIEGDGGSLLNIYSPFMALATKAAKAGLPIRPAQSDLEKARKRFARDVAYYSDSKNRFKVKFAVSFYGQTPDFAKSYSARIHGIGRGKEFTLAPTKQILDQIADPVTGGREGSTYEAVNGYYFDFVEIQDLQEYELTLQSPKGPTLVFRINNERLY
jgi:hypothetical protein